MNSSIPSAVASRRTFLRGSALTAGALAFGLPAASGTGLAKRSGRQPGTIPVFASDVDTVGGRFYRIAQAGAASDAFVKGPEKPPFGAGSLQFSTTGPADRLFFYNYDYGSFDVATQQETNEGVALADITDLSYSTYTNDSTLVPALKMEIDPTGPDASGFDYATLNFEPYYNNTVVPGTWQTWDLLTADAGLWLSRVTGEGSISQPVTWSRLLELYPDATIRFGFGVGVGSGWAAPSFVGHVDDLTIGVDGTRTRYDFKSRGKDRK